jgi:prepilin-type processing-associated H-X9-DG protein
VTLRRPGSRTGGALFQVIVVVIIIAILVSMMPCACVRGHSLAEARRVACAHSLKQLNLSLRMYANEHDGLAPVIPVDADGRPAGGQPHGLATTAASLEWLLASQDSGGSASWLRCRGLPRDAPPPAAPTLFTGGPSPWGAAAGRGTWIPAYAFDWSLPSQASARRIVVADRWAAHGDGRSANAAFADGHVGTVAVVAGPADALGRRLILSGRNPEVPDDDPWTGAGDDGDPWTPGKGSATRCFLR